MYIHRSNTLTRMLRNRAQQLDDQKVSCIIPVFNGERFLDQAITSVLMQTKPPQQIIVVDDGSTDATAQIIASFGDRVEHVTQTNQGPAAARNAGLDRATGEFIAFQDADDIWLPEKLECQLRHLLDDDAAIACVCLVRNFWEPELQEEAAAVATTRHNLPLAGYVFQAMLARRSAFTSIGRLDQSLRLAEDADWFDRARALGHRVAVVDQTLVRRRYHGANLSRSIANSSAARDAMLEVVFRNLQRKRNAPISD